MNMMINPLAMLMSLISGTAAPTAENPDTEGFDQLLQDTAARSAESQIAEAQAAPAPVVATDIVLPAPPAAPALTPEDTAFLPPPVVETSVMPIGLAVAPVAPPVVHGAEPVAELPAAPKPVADEADESAQANNEQTVSVDMAAALMPPVPVAVTPVSSAPETSVAVDADEPAPVINMAAAMPAPVAPPPQRPQGARAAVQAPAVTDGDVADLAASLDAMVVGGAQDKDASVAVPANRPALFTDDNSDTPFAVDDDLNLNTGAPASVERPQGDGYRADAARMDTGYDPNVTTRPAGTASAASGSDGVIIVPPSFDLSAASGTTTPLGLSAVQPSAVMGAALSPSPGAVPSHPAVATISAVLHKAASNRETQDLTISLNPPELGRVQARLSYNKNDNSVSAHIFVENKDTFMLMQRDAHALHNALTSAGLDVGTGGLNFELADQSPDFSGFMAGNDNQRGGGRDGADPSSSGADAAGMVAGDSNVWTVDPATGRQRYSILA